MEKKTELTQDELRQMKLKFAKAFALIRNQLLIELPFIGSVAMHFNLVPVRDKRCRTACTDSKSIYWDMDFFSGLTPAEREFVLGHEIWHNLMLHFARRMGRDKELFNIATDMEVNNILVKTTTSGRKSFEPLKNLLFPPRELEGKSAEVIYAWLLKKRDAGKLGKALEECIRHGGGSGSGSGAQDEKKDGTLSGQFDEHIFNDDVKNSDGEDGEDGAVTDRWGEVGYDSDFKPSVDKDAVNRMRETAITAAQTYKREYGSLPYGADILLDKVMKPEIDWRAELCNFVSSHIGCHRTLVPPNRRFVHEDMYMYRRRSDAIRIGCFIDTSGSTEDELPKFFGELKGIVDVFGSYEIHRIDCDCEVDHYEIYDDETNPLDPSSISMFEAHGGGGTSFDPPFKYVEENGIEFDMAIYMTDGYAPKVTVDKPPYSVLWLVTKDGSMDFCEWGRKVRFKTSAGYDY